MLYMFLRNNRDSENDVNSNIQRLTTGNQNIVTDIIDDSHVIA